MGINTGEKQVRKIMKKVKSQWVVASMGLLLAGAAALLGMESVSAAWVPRTPEQIEQALPDNGTYTVQSGDTVWALSQATGKSSSQIMRELGLSHAGALRVGAKVQTGFTPSAAYAVKKGDTLTGIARAHGVTVSDGTTSRMLTSFTRVSH